MVIPVTVALCAAISRNPQLAGLFLVRSNFTHFSVFYTFLIVVTENQLNARIASISKKWARDGHEEKRKQTENNKYCFDATAHSHWTPLIERPLLH